MKEVFDMKVKAFVEKHRKPLRVIAAVIAFAMIAVLLEFANELLGNPVSYLVAKHNAKKYVAENYADEGYVVKDASYFFKFKDYAVHVAKPDGEDCQFLVYYNMFGAFRGDNYESLVGNGENVRTRLDMSYRELVKSVLESPANPYNKENAIQYGRLIFESDEAVDKGFDYGFGLSRDILIPDKQYDIAELGARGGLLKFSADIHGEATAEKAAETLLDVAEFMERGGAPFYAIDLMLESSDGDYYIVENFLRSDIYEDGLVERVRSVGMTEDEYNARGETK